jgi:hypothetical protein
MSDYMVTAIYEPKMDKKREKRINAALDRCNVKRAVHMGNAATEDGDYFPICFSEINWMSCKDGSGTELEISVDDDRERAKRLASELRACGMVTAIATLPG